MIDGQHGNDFKALNIMFSLTHRMLPDTKQMTYHVADNFRVDDDTDAEAL